MFIEFDSQWFHAYCRAVVAGDHETIRKQFPEANRSMRKALRSAKLSKADRKALREALHYLDLTRTLESKKRSRGIENLRSKRKSA